MDGVSFVAGLPAGLDLTDPDCGVMNGVKTCTFAISGNIGVPDGAYAVRTTVTDDDGGATSAEVTITVEPENGVISFDTANPIALPVASPGGSSGPFAITVYASELFPDQAVVAAQPGEIGLADVSMILVPVGPGNPVNGSCTPDTPSGTGHDTLLPVTCQFADVSVSTYSLDVTVDGGYYTGSNDDVFTVFDPSLGFTTGGGWFYWPETGERTNFGYTMKYNKKRTNIQGSLLVIRHIPGAPEGFNNYRIKSNAIYGLALGDAGDPVFGWASFDGKATFKAPGADNEGNHEFTIYVEDHGEPGTGVDQFWLQTRGKDDNVIPDMSMPFPGASNTETIKGGNIVVPH
jgi:hypothetical protein